MIDLIEIVESIIYLILVESKHYLETKSYNLHFAIFISRITKS